MGKHLEILPYLLKNYEPFLNCVKNSKLKTIGLDNYVTLECDIKPKWLSWYIKIAKEEENFININIKENIEFTFKCPKDYNWYIPILFSRGCSAMHADHINLYFINKTLAARESSQGFYF